MPLSKPKLFISILAFMLIVNLLVIFNLNQLYIRAILAFIFIITIPGLLIMLCLKIRNIGFWEYLVYTIGLSIAFIMFAGLAINWILPWLNITDKPLSLWPILICFNIFLIIFWLVAYKRNLDLKFNLKFPKFSWLDRIFILWAFFFPFMAVIGAFLLNNHGTNIVTMTMLGMIALYVLLIVIFRNKLNENVFPWALWVIGLSLLLMGSMRGWFISGADINLESSILKITINKGLWDVNNFYQLYNSTLSVTIFPAIIKILCLNINISFLFKFLFEGIISLIGISVYILGKKLLDKDFAFISSLFFLFQTPIFGYGIPIRQQIAFLFFGLMLLTLFNKKINMTLKKSLFVIFGFSMIVSHYSTSYIALAIFLCTYILAFFYRLLEKRKIEEKSEFFLTLGVILLLFIFGFLWYSQMTPTANSLIDFVKKSFSNLDNMFGADVQSQGGSILDQLKLDSNRGNYESILNSYKTETISDINNEKIELYNSEYNKIRIKFPENSNLKVDYKIFSVINNLTNILKLSSKFLIAFGAMYLFFRLIKKQEKELIIFLAGFIMLIFLLSLPFVSITYDTIRIYQQLLFLLSFIFIIGFYHILFFIKKENRIVLMTVYICLYLIFLTGYLYQFTGGISFFIFENNGSHYFMHYTHKGEIFSSSWLLINKDKNWINLDTRAGNKLILSDYYNGEYFTQNVVPWLIRNRSYVFSSYTNKMSQIGFKSFNGNVISFSFPIEFLDNKKNKIYNNGGSEIFR